MSTAAGQATALLIGRRCATIRSLARRLGENVQRRSLADAVGKIADVDNLARSAGRRLACKPPRQVADINDSAGAASSLRCLRQPVREVTHVDDLFGGRRTGKELGCRSATGGGAGGLNLGDLIGGTDSADTTHGASRICFKGVEQRGFDLPRTIKNVRHGRLKSNRRSGSYCHSTTRQEAAFSR